MSGHRRKWFCCFEILSERHFFDVFNIIQPLKYQTFLSSITTLFHICQIGGCSTLFLGLNWTDTFKSSHWFYLSHHYIPTLLHKQFWHAFPGNLFSWSIEEQASLIYTFIWMWFAKSWRMKINGLVVNLLPIDLLLFSSMSLRSHSLLCNRF